MATFQKTSPETESFKKNVSITRDNFIYTSSDNTLNKLYYCFLADDEDADAYTLPAETLIGNKADGVKGYFETYTEEHGGELINNRFSKGLFESVFSSAILAMIESSLI